MKKVALFLVLILTAISGLIACDMSAFIIRKGMVLADFNSIATDEIFTNFDVPKDYLAYVMSRSNSAMQNDGYGLIYYPRDTRQINEDNCWYKYVHRASESNLVYYTGNMFDPLNEPDLFDIAYNKIKSPASNTAIVMCHARNASVNPFAPGNHPFRLNVNGHTYSFMHNGYVSTSARTFMINETNIMDNGWFEQHTPNYSNFTDAAYPACWIDSEVLFNYIMCHIVHNDYNVYNGMKIALKKLETYIKLSNNIVNFVFSDGIQLYAFRSTALSGSTSSYKLSFRVSNLGYSGIRTGIPTLNETQVNQYELVALADNGSVSRYPYILHDPLINSGVAEADLNELAQRTLGSVVDPNQMGVGISFFLDEAAHVKLNIYNLKGQRVCCLTDSFLQEGAHTLRWDGRDSKGKTASRGMYYLEMQSGKSRTVSKLIYTK